MTIDPTPASFPSDFLWGVATAGHQSEGENTASDIWTLERTRPSLFRERSGPACGSYHRFEEDLDLVAGMGLNAYRFSVEWARIEPHRGEVVVAELDHYEQVVDAALARGLAPIVTLNHFASPHWFAAAGSWLAADAAELFARQCDRVMARLGDRIAAAVTLNEPNLEQLLQAGSKLPPEAEQLKEDMLAAAARDAGTAQYFASNVIPARAQAAFQEGFTRAHRAARDAVKDRRGDLPVGVSIAIADDVALPGGEAHRDARRAAVYDHWLDVAREDDFIGVQNYERFHFDAGGEVSPGADDEVNGMGSVAAAGSLAGAVRYAHQRSGVPVLVTEHGMQTEDDSRRAAFIPDALAELGQEIAAGTPVLGYCHWTLLDNFEWISGYGSKLGLVAVDRASLERSPKPSCAAYAAAVRAAREAAAAPAEAALLSR
ncbi:family 1 glycosylhydrolase [Brachybacterium phenoliresistens]|uniref:Beta-glucosidase n=1 Tax=Brachybacterium phenoliresistens TaxID=396014 RepID=Z9JXC0_9MICO|nr:family 1 glycosylhydrolase [Brachybacterium phenoliresistens]EWS82638.1 beta-glucosidase [Brachybacterium phenoliresistens]